MYIVYIKQYLKYLFIFINNLILTNKGEHLEKYINYPIFNWFVYYGVVGFSCSAQNRNENEMLASNLETV